jgi:hypothetical protein
MATTHRNQSNDHQSWSSARREQAEEDRRDRLKAAEERRLEDWLSTHPEASRVEAEYRLRDR